MIHREDRQRCLSAGEFGARRGLQEAVAVVGEFRQGGAAVFGAVEDPVGGEGSAEAAASLLRRLIAKRRLEQVVQVLGAGLVGGLASLKELFQPLLLFPGGDELPRDGVGLALHRAPDPAGERDGQAGKFLAGRHLHQTTARWASR